MPIEFGGSSKSDCKSVKRSCVEVVAPFSKEPWLSGHPHVEPMLKW